MGKAKYQTVGNSGMRKCNKSPLPNKKMQHRLWGKKEEMELREMGGLQFMGSQEKDTT